MDQLLSRLRPFAYPDITEYTEFLAQSGGWPSSEPPTPEELTARWKRRGRDPESTIFVLPGPDGLIAHLVVAPFDDRSHRVALEMAVLPAFRRQGLGSALLNLGLDRARQLGALRVSTPVFVRAGESSDCAVTFLTARAYSYAAAYWQMRFNDLRLQEAPLWPEGYGPLPFTRVSDAPDRWAALIEACFGESATAAGIETQIREPGSSPEGYFFAEETATGHLVGTSRARLDPAPQGVLGYVGTVGVLPEHRRKGIAQALMLETIAYLKSRGARDAVLFVEDRNSGARALYERMGWFPVFRTEHYWRPVNTKDSH